MLIKQNLGLVCPNMNFQKYLQTCKTFICNYFYKIFYWDFLLQRAVSTFDWEVYYLELCSLHPATPIHKGLGAQTGVGWCEFSKPPGPDSLKRVWRGVFSGLPERERGAAGVCEHLLAHLRRPLPHIGTEPPSQRPLLAIRS